MGKESESTKVYYDFYLDFYVLQTVTTSPDSAIHVFFLYCFNTNSQYNYSQLSQRKQAILYDAGGSRHTLTLMDG